MKTRIVGLLVFHMSLLMLLTNCTNIDETIISENGGMFSTTDSWICDIQSYEEDEYRYQLQLDEIGHYTAMSRTKMLKVSKDGDLISINFFDFQDDDIYHIEVYKNRIYRFHYENFNYDPTEPMKLQIYDFDSNLLSEHVLDTYGTFADVKFESETEFVMLINNPDDIIITFKKFDLSAGLIAEKVLSTSHSTHPYEIHLIDNEHYFCTGRRSFLLDKDLNILWEFDVSKRISDVKYIDGKGIYVTGGTESVDFENASFVALLDLDGNTINSIEYDAMDRYYLPRMQINSDKICLTQLLPTDFEGSRDMMLSILDYDLNIESVVNIPGGSVGSNIVVNEFGSFSFVYGKVIDPTNLYYDAPANTRILKFDASYEVPTNVIIQ